MLTMRGLFALPVRSQVQIPHPPRCPKVTCNGTARCRGGGAGDRRRCSQWGYRASACPVFASAIRISRLILSTSGSRLVRRRCRVPPQLNITDLHWLVARLREDVHARPLGDGIFRCCSRICARHTRSSRSSSPDCDRGDQEAVIAAEPRLGGDFGDGQARSCQ